ASRNWEKTVTLTLNAGWRFGHELNDGGAHLGDQASQIHIGAGFILLPQSRLQLVNEYNSVIFSGGHTPNQTFGARDPLDGTWGVRIFPTQDLGIDIGYRQMVNLGNTQDRHGFVIKLGYAHHSVPRQAAANRARSAAVSLPER